MSNSNNHIDHWLQGSAALGKMDVVNKDWIAMQQLLQQKRKRRIVFFWFSVAAILVVLCLLIYYSTSWSNKKMHNEKTIDSLAIKTTTNNKVLGVTDKTNTTANANESKVDSITGKNNNIAQPLANKQNSKIGAIASLSFRTQNRLHMKQAPILKKTLQQTVVPVNGGNFTINKPAATNTKANTAFDKILSDIENVKQTSGNYTSNIMYMHNRYIDSLANKKDSVVVTKIDTTKKQNQQTTNTTTKPKKTSALKSFAEISAGYGVMNIGTGLNTGVVQFQYSFNVAKNLFVDVNAKAFPYNNTDKQRHKNIYRIVPPVPGTAFTEVDIKETEYNIANGFVAEPGIGLHYKAGKIELGVSWHYGNVFNATNTVTAVSDTFNFFTSLPATIRLNNAYDANNFIGKKYSTFAFNCAYQFAPKFFATTGYAYMDWYNSIDGVADAIKKRNSFYFTVGYRF